MINCVQWTDLCDDSWQVNVSQQPIWSEWKITRPELISEAPTTTEPPTTTEAPITTEPPTTTEPPFFNIDGLIDLVKNQKVGSIDSYYDNFEISFELKIQPNGLSSTHAISLQGLFQVINIVISLTKTNSLHFLKQLLGTY